MKIKRNYECCAVAKTDSSWVRKVRELSLEFIDCRVEAREMYSRYCQFLESGQRFDAKSAKYLLTMLSDIYCMAQIRKALLKLNVNVDNWYSPENWEISFTAQAFTD